TMMHATAPPAAALTEVEVEAADMAAPLHTSGLPVRSTGVSVQRPSHGVELLLEVSRERGRLHPQIEDGVAAGARPGRLGAGAPLPSSRSLAAELGVARSVVV